MNKSKKVSITLTLNQLNGLRIAAGAIMDHPAKYEVFVTSEQIRSASSAYKKLLKTLDENWTDIYPTEEGEDE